MLDDQTLTVARNLLDLLRRSGEHVVTAESCTGGLIAASLTHHAGASDVVEGGMVTYSNAMKQSELGVRAQTLARHGAVSAKVAREMAEGALHRALDATIAIAVTGIAGPGGGSADKPLGLVWFGLARRGRVGTVESRIFDGDRAGIRARTVRHALDLIAGALAVGA